MSTSTTPLVWDKSDAGAWLKDPLAETTRHGEAMTAQFPPGHAMTYMPQSATVHLGPLGHPTGRFLDEPVVPLCGARLMSAVILDAIPGSYGVCSVCTARYNGASVVTS